MINNRIVTQGLSRNTKNLLVTRGFIPSFIQEVVETGRRILIGAGKAARRAGDRLEEIIVYARLVSVNKVELDEPVKGWVRITIDKSRRFVVNVAHSAVNTIKTKLDEIFISIKRIK